MTVKKAVGKAKRITTRELGKKTVKGKGGPRQKMKMSVVLDCGGSDCQQLRVINVPHATELIINVGCRGPHGLFVTRQPL